MTEAKKSFEDRLQEVQEIISRIEEGKLPLEDSVKQYETGMKTLAELDEGRHDRLRRPERSCRRMVCAL